MKSGGCGFIVVGVHRPRMHGKRNTGPRAGGYPEVQLTIDTR